MVWQYQVGIINFIMHVYIYDDYINTKKYDEALARIETRITDLGLNGKIIRLGVMKNIQEAVDNEIKQGAKTIVAVGNDKTISQLVNALIRYKKNQAETNVPLGIIPIGEKNNSIAPGLGIKEGEEACDALSARRVELIDVAQANSFYFLSQATITSQETTLEIGKNYSIEIMEPGKISIINLPILKEQSKNVKSSPQDNLLELYIKTKAKKIIRLNQGGSQSFFSAKKITIINKKFPLVIDNTLKISTPVEISITREKLNIIVGKERNF